MDDFGFMPVLFGENKRRRSSNFFLSRTKTNRTHQRNQHVWAINLRIQVAYIRDVVGGFDIIDGDNLHIILGGNFYDTHRGVRQVTQREELVGDGYFFGHFKTGNQRRIFHVQGLRIAFNLPPVDTSFVYLQMHVHMIEGF